MLSRSIKGSDTGGIIKDFSCYTNCIKNKEMSWDENGNFMPVIIAGVALTASCDAEPY